MAMINQAGAFKTVPVEELKIPESTLVSPIDKQYSTDVQQSQLAHIQDTFTTKTALNPVRFGETYSMLLGFPEGTPRTVTYFHRNESNISTKTISAELDRSEHSVHTDLTRINNFEIRLLESISYEEDADTDEMSISFNAVVYPGFVPISGDIIFMNIGDGRIGEFQVDEIVRTSYRQGTYHRIQCILISALTTTRLEYYKSVTKEELVFDKTIYFNQNFTFLKHSSYVSLETLQNKRKEIIQWYFDKFYDSVSRTMLRPDKIYDPYIVQFILKHISMWDSGKRPVQLLPDVPDYKKSIWYFLSDSKNINFSNMIPTYTTVLNNRYFRDTSINYLLNKKYIKLGTGTVDLTVTDNIYNDALGGYQYVVSYAFYAEHIPSMNRLENILHGIKLNSTISPEVIIDQLSNYQNLDDYTAFYHIPIYVHLIDICVRTLINPII